MLSHQTRIVKRNNLGGLDKRMTFARRRREKFIDDVKAGTRKSIRNASHLAHSWRRICRAGFDVTRDFAEVTQ